MKVVTKESIGTCSSGSSHQKKVQSMKVVTNTSIGTCSSGLYIPFETSGTASRGPGSIWYKLYR